jgi:hypothetical protein
MPRGGETLMPAASLLVRAILVGIVVLSQPAASATMTPSDKEMYEKLGLSEAEWGMILDSHMPMSKVNFLLKSGISIAEYFRCPWKDLGLSEGEWIAKRKSGLSDNDMKVVKHAPRQGAPYIGAFFLPGCFQFTRHEPVRAWIMSTVAVGMIALCAGQSIAKKRFQPLGLFLLFPDMIWSGVDIGFQVEKEQNPDASRFSLAPFPEKAAVSLRMKF